MDFLEKYKNMPIPAKAGIWFLICSFLQKGISMISTPIFTRLLTTEEFGYFSVFNSWYGVLSIFVTLSLYSGVFSQGLVKFEEDNSRFCSSMQGLSLTLVAFWSVIYILFRNFWNHLFSLTTLEMLALLAMCWSTASFSFWAVEKRTEYNYRQFVALTIIASIAKPAIGIILVLSCDDRVTARIVGLAAVEVICSILPFFQQVKHGKVLYNRFYWTYAFRLTLPLVPHYLSQTVLNSSDRIMIERMSGVEDVGIYSLAYSVSMIMLLFNNALGMTIGPWMFQKIKSKMKNDIAKIAYVALMFVALMNLLLITFAPEIVRIFAPVEYYNAIWVIPPVAMSSFFLFMYDFFARYEFYFEKTKGIMYASIIGAVLNVILNYIAIPIWGYIAAGYTTLICYIFYVIMHYILMKRACNAAWGNCDVYDVKKLITISVVFMMLGFMTMVLYNHSIIRYILLTTLTVIVLINKEMVFALASELLSMRNKNE